MRDLLFRFCRYTGLAVGLFGFGLAPVPVQAGPFAVAPVRIYMAPRDRAVALTITNRGDEELVMQAELFRWQQNPDGSNLLTPTEDLLLAPPIIRLPAGARQVVRLALLRSPDPDRQLTYRVILREIVEAHPPEQGVQVQIAMAFSLPIFITPPGAAARLDCQLHKAAATNASQLGCRNTGQAYAHPRAFGLSTPDGKQLVSGPLEGYILPGIERRYALKLPSPLPPGRYRLDLTLDDGTTRHFDITMAD